MANVPNVSIFRPPAIGIRMDAAAGNLTDDWELLGAYAHSRAQDPFARLAAKYSPMVFATALRRTRRRDLAEDVTQAVFIILARRAGELRPHGSLAAWLHRTALLASSEALRAEQRRRKHETLAAAQAASAAPALPRDPGDDPAALVEDALRRMRARDRDVLALRYLEGRSVRETAAILGLTEAAARKRLTRALQTLRQRLAGRGITKSLVGTGAAVAALAALAAPTKTSATIGAAMTPALAPGAGGANTGAFELAHGVLRTLRLIALKQAAVAAAAVMLLLLSGAALVGPALRTATPRSPQASVRPPTTLASYLPPERGIVFQPDVWLSGNVEENRNTGQFNWERVNGIDRFTVSQPGRWRIWSGRVWPTVDPNRFPILKMQYRSTASGTGPARFALWLNDSPTIGVPPGTPVIGLFYCPASSLIHDGHVHVFRADLRQPDTRNRRPRGPIKELMLGIACGPRSPATFEVLAMHFEVPDDAEGR